MRAPYRRFVMRRVLFVAAALAGILLLPNVVHAQAAIAGVIRDASAAVLPGVTVIRQQQDPGKRCCHEQDSAHYEPPIRRAHRADHSISDTRRFVAGRLTHSQRIEGLSPSYVSDRSDE